MQTHTFKAGGGGDWPKSETHLTPARDGGPGETPTLEVPMTTYLRCFLPSYPSTDENTQLHFGLPPPFIEPLHPPPRRLAVKFGGGGEIKPHPTTPHLSAARIHRGQYHWPHKRAETTRVSVWLHTPVRKSLRKQQTSTLGRMTHGSRQDVSSDETSGCRTKTLQCGSPCFTVSSIHPHVPHVTSTDRLGPLGG